MVGLMVTSKRAHAKGHLPGLLLPASQSPQQASATVNPCLHRRASNISRWVWLSVLWGHCSFPLGPGVHKTQCQDWSLCKSYGQVPLACKVRFPGDSYYLCWIPKLGSLLWGSEPSQHWKDFFGRTVLHFAVAHLVEFDFIMIVSLLLSHCGFSFVFVCGVCFFGGSQHPPVNCPTASCDFGALTGGGECMSFYSTVLNQSSCQLGFCHLHPRSLARTVGWFSVFARSASVNSTSLRWKVFETKISEISQKQNLNLLHGQHLNSICVVLGIVSTPEMI